MDNVDRNAIRIMLHEYAENLAEGIDPKSWLKAVQEEAKALLETTFREG